MTYPDISTYEEGFNHFRIFSVQGTPWLVRKNEGRLDIIWPDGRLNLSLCDRLQKYTGRRIEEICQGELGDWLRKEWDYEQAELRKEWDYEQAERERTA